MTSQERAALLRKRFKILGGTLLQLPKAKPREPERVYRNRFSFGPLIPHEPCKWVQKPDEWETPLLQLPKKEGVSPLVKIAEQLPIKLKRIRS